MPTTGSQVHLLSGTPLFFKIKLNVKTFLTINVLNVIWNELCIKFGNSKKVYLLKVLKRALGVYIITVQREKWTRQLAQKT